MSETSKHTPGPWMVEPESFEDSGPALGSHYKEPTIVADGKTIATVRVGLAGTEANARLIAVAPELLAACKAALRNLDPYSRPVQGRTALRLLDAAICKAEGRS